jgi:hypothetical protein
MSTLDATARLAAVLDDLATALAVPDAEALWAIEARLGPALAAVAAPGDVSPSDRARMAEVLAGARLSLTRCEVLGASLSDAARLSLMAQGLSGHYGPSGGDAGAVASVGRGQHLRARL